MKRVHFFVSGNVQGVCYRFCSAEKARELRLRGFAKNTSDGKVEIMAEGKDNKINEFLAFCRNNPGYSDVDRLDIVEDKKTEDKGFDDFEVRH